MEIISKSIFALIDYSMDCLRLEYPIREKYLKYLTSYYELEEETIRKWSKVGKGLDYYTFKDWIAKDNRFKKVDKELELSVYGDISYYHDIGAIISCVLENSYEQLIQLYQCLGLLVLVDKKRITKRIDYLNWCGRALCLDEEDCAIIRESILIEFKLDFNDQKLDIFKKKSIFVQGVSMALVSDEIIDDHETKFLDHLSSKLNLDFEQDGLSLYLKYLTQELFAEDKQSVAKIAAFLLHLIGCDEDISKSEIKWFKKMVGPMNLERVKQFMDSDKSQLLRSLSANELCLTYILALEVSLADLEIHASERYWLDEIKSCFSPGFEVSKELYFIFLSVAERNLAFVSKYRDYFDFITNKYNGHKKEDFKVWVYGQTLNDSKINYSDLFSTLFNEELELTSMDQLDFLVQISSPLINYKSNEVLMRNYKLMAKLYFESNVEGFYSELLICELLKISLIDGVIEELEDDFIRALQYRFSVSESSIFDVIFYTSFLLGRQISLRERVNYDHL
ncbi:TerB family tellurite resistance protein [Halobacteriovorax sp. HLS]|uniref:TerB family tellurite resistance protein n=1 Tax=Halobacteriovorax sp. HLS TaxID=2234000 RepID=UPI000FD989D4|nr:TerB family tellurite resistance protein [Halobacteriovorax sp. HLS]